MAKALEYAQHSFDQGNFPVGALLVIDDKIISGAGNDARDTSKRSSHAEHKLLYNNAPLLKASKGTIRIYTTLEPCIMCYGHLMVERVNEVIYACPDPYGGATNIQWDVPFHKKRKPKITRDILRQDSLDLLLRFMEKQKSPGWKMQLEYFKDL